MSCYQMTATSSEGYPHKQREVLVKQIYSYTGTLYL